MHSRGSYTESTIREDGTVICTCDCGWFARLPSQPGFAGKEHLLQWCGIMAHHSMLEIITDMGRTDG